MKEKLFPRMVNYPEFKPRVGGLCYFFAYVFFVPALVIGLGSLFGVAFVGSKFESSKLFYILIYLFTFGACIIVNFLVVRFFFRDFLKYSFIDVRQNKKTVFRYVLIGFVLFLCAELIVFAAVGMEKFFSGLPFADPMYGEAPAVLWLSCPIPATLFYLTIVPITMACLYYGTVFGPACEKSPLLAYGLVILMSFVPHFLMLFSKEMRGFAVTQFFQMLPLHLLSAWVYQKTDTIWTSVFLHIAADLCGILLLLLVRPSFLF